MFSVDEIKAAAIAVSGLTDFGSADFEEPLSILVRAQAEEAQLSEIGQQAMRDDLVNDLVGRLRVIDGLKKFPAALEETIERPIFILGFPRTGTTTLHNMIQAAPDCQVLEHWLGLNPKSRPPREQWNADADYIKVTEALEALYRANPQLRAQHDIGADSADECRFLFKQLLTDDSYGYLYGLSSYWEWFDAQSMIPAYHWHKGALKLLQYPHDAKRRWILKYPTHMAWIEDLLTVYPDACIIQTHRDPVATIPSFASLIWNAAKVFSPNRAPEQLGLFLARQWHGRVERFMETRERLQREHQFFDLQFSEVLKDPVSGVRQAFEHFGLNLSNEAEVAMREWHTNHPPSRHGNHAYSAEEFGLGHDELSAMFANYRERYSIPVEVR